ncbi:antirestriction protein [Xenorhabdus sp. KJ12.1]|nr:antirestriction protein [Xenorhabdus sp. KJ12.1]
MQKSDLIMLDSPALSAVFPGKKPLERLFLGFLIANTAAQLCGEYQYEYWDRRDVSEQLTYMVPTSVTTYSVYLPDSALTVTLSADAFGLAVTTAVFARISVLDESNEDAYRFGELHEYARQHPEAELIRTVLDLSTPDKVLSPSLIRRINNNHNHHQ